MSAQSELNAIFEKLARDHGKLSAKQQAFAIKELGRVRGDIADFLADFSDDDGTIKRQRMSRVLRELNEVEASLREYGTAAMDHTLTTSAAFATERINGGFERIFDRAAITGSFSRLNRDVVDYVAKRFGDDGLTLSDRVWRLSGDTRDEISKVLRANILQGESTSKMIADIRKVQDAETWKIKRLVVTEGNAAYRTSAAFNASRSDVVKGLRLHPGRERSPICVGLSEENRHGLGRGIFLPDDSDIYSPHPSCTSFITYEVKDDYL